MRLPRSPRHIALSSAVAILAAACGGADGEKGAAVRVEAGAVALAPAAGGGATVPDARSFRADAAAMIARLPRFPARAREGAAPRLDVTGTWSATGEEAAVRVEAKLQGVDARVPIRAAIVATGRAQGRSDASELARRGVDDLGKALASMFVLYGADEAAWVRALDGAEPDEQLLALALLADGKCRAAVPAIGAVLDDPRAQVAEAAADALVAIGDWSAVPVLIAGIRRGDVRSEVRAIEAISKLGGNEARAYLEMTAIGHEIPEVRALSLDALERLEEVERKHP
ncbi:MAG: HEAT repeat domain-containing protein [Proteobacteria bacterium]|jgi:hypothetical protein|nr:HEAT repeat domain-containing protein [Pseudomonadota bacterium]